MPIRSSRSLRSTSLLLMLVLLLLVGSAQVGLAEAGRAAAATIPTPVAPPVMMAQLNDHELLGQSLMSQAAMGQGVSQSGGEEIGGQMGGQMGGQTGGQSGGSIIDQTPGQTTQQPTTPSGHMPPNNSGATPIANRAVPPSDRPLPRKPGALRIITTDSSHPLLVPRLAKPPKLEEFLSGKPRGLIAQSMLAITGFIQQDPDDGAPVTEPTSAYLGYTSHDLYLAFICGDRTPGAIRAHLLPRDSLGDDDKVEVTLDTFDDHRRGLMFQSNALGIEADATYTEGGSPDFSFDTVWDTFAKRTSFGYVVIMRIPFQSLRFKSKGHGQTQVWGIVLRRWVAHESERAYWPQISRQIAGRLTQEASIRGFADVQRGHNIQFIPYGLLQSYRKLDDRNPLNPTFDQKNLQGTAGLDSKFVIHDSLVLDTTLNPDFSQVNVDNPAPPNQRFQTFFAEQRPFFIENANYFATPIDLFYTLNIVSPQFGARLSGKDGPWAIGLLATDDRSPGQAAEPGTQYANTRAYYYVARIARDIGPYSSAGLLYTDREYQGSFNRLGGLDYRYRFDKKWTPTGQGITSATRNLDGTTSSGDTFKQNINFTNENLYFSTTYNDTAAGFIDAVGFFRRPDDREGHIYTKYTWRPAGKLILAHGPQLYVEQDWDHTGLALDSVFHLGYKAVLARRSQINANLDVSNDRLRPSDYAALTRNIEYRSQTVNLDASTSPVPQFSLEVNAYTGQTVNYNPPVNSPPLPINIQSALTTLDLKPITRLDLLTSYEIDRFRAPGASLIAYDNHQAIARWNLQMTNALAFRLTGIYEATLPDARYTAQQNTKDFFADVLLAYVPHPGTAVYLGYTSDSQNLNPSLCTRLETGQCDPNGVFLNHTGDSLLSDSRALYLKVSYLLRF